MDLPPGIEGILALLRPRIVEAIGPLLLFMCFALVLYGVFCAQVYFYWTTYRRDLKLTRVFVASICVAETVHTAILIHTMYRYFVVGFGDFLPDQDGFMTVIWSAIITVLLALLIVIAIQSFYICRIWKLSEGSRIVVVTLSFFLAAKFVFSFAATMYMFRLHEWALIYYHNTIMAVTNTALTLGVVTDLAFTSCLSFYLKRNRAERGRTKQAINQLIQFTLHSGIVTAVFTIAILIVFNVVRHSLVYLGLVAVLSKVYANVMLATLNARRSLLESMGTDDSINPLRLSPGRIEANHYLSPRSPNTILETRVEIFKETVVMTDEEFGATRHGRRNDGQSMSDEGHDVDKR